MHNGLAIAMWKFFAEPLMKRTHKSDPVTFLHAKLIYNYLRMYLPTQQSSYNCLVYVCMYASNFGSAHAVQHGTSVSYTT